MPSFSIPAAATTAAIASDAAATTAAVATTAAGTALGIGDVAAAGGLAAGETAIGATSLASTLYPLSLAGSALGGLTSAVGAIQSGAAQSAAAGYQAQVAANNEKIAQQNAAQATATGAVQVEQQGIKTKAEVGAIKAAQAASNIDVNTGSALDVRSSAAALGELDALTIRSNAEKQAYGYETQATSFAGQQSLAESEASEAEIGAGIGAFGSVLGGATGVGNTYLKWQTAAGGTGTSPVAIFG